MTDAQFNGDLLIRAGDFVVADSEPQEIEAIVCSHQGENRQFPLLGFGIAARLNAPFDPAKFRKDLRLQLAQDDLLRLRIEFNDPLEISAERLIQ